MSLILFVKAKGDRENGILDQLYNTHVYECDNETCDCIVHEEEAPNNIANYYEKGESSNKSP